MKIESTPDVMFTPIHASRTSLSRKMLPVLLAGFSLLAGNSEAVFITGFENPPFTTGQPYGKVQDPYGTWGGTESSNLWVVSGVSYEGTQSLSATSFGTTATTNSPNLYDWGFTGISFYFMNPTAEFAVAGQSIARWELTWQNNAPSLEDPNPIQYRVTMNLRFATDDTFDLRFDTTPSTGVLPSGSGATRAITTGNVDYTDWTRIDLNFDYDTKSLVVLMTNPDNSTFTTTVALNTTNFVDTSRVAVARFGVSSTAPSGAGGVVYYDNFSAVPEPSTALLAACGLGLLVMRRKGRMA
jgi:hypothetical protein